MFPLIDMDEVDKMIETLQNGLNKKRTFLKEACMAKQVINAVRVY